MRFKPAARPPDGNDSLRDRYLLEGLFRPGELNAVYWETDRTVIGGAVPLGKGVALSAADMLGAATFCERREAGIINLGGSGRIEVGGRSITIGSREGYYAGRGSHELVFHSDSPDSPACFYILSYAAHRECASRKVALSDLKGEKLGTPEAANLRILYKYFAPGIVDTCQLTMGLTELAGGNVWNTMPPHTHQRRSEVYCYFNIPDGQAVFHFMGAPDATRHLIVHDLEAVLSPPWSIHCGAGTASYSFIWGMGGENQDFDDMDMIPIDALT